MTKRTIEVFTSGCPVCQPTVDLVKKIALDCGRLVGSLPAKV